MFFIEFTYQTINMIFAWFAIGNFFLVFRILTTSLGGDTLLGNVGVILGTVFEWLYAATLVSCFVLALGNRPEGSNGTLHVHGHFLGIHHDVSFL